MRSLVIVALGLLLLGAAIIYFETAGNLTATPQTQLSVLPFSTGTHHEALMGFTETGEFVFTRSDKDFSESYVYMTHQTSTGRPTQKAFYSFSGYELGYTKLGKDTVLFTSNADPDDQTLSRDWNIWQNIDAENFQTLPPPMNSSGLECCVVAGLNNTFYFSSDRDGTWDIYIATWEEGTFRTVAKLAHPNTGSNGEWPSYVDPEGRFMLFSSIRETGMGGDDIYISYRKGEGWSEAVLMPAPINSNTYEDNAILSPDGKYLYWSSRRPTDFSKGIGNIYILETDAPELKDIIPGPGN